MKNCVGTRSKNSIILALHSKFSKFNLPIRLITRIIESYLEEIREAIMLKERVLLPKVGSIRYLKTTKRQKKLPTGEIITIESAEVPRMRFCEDLREGKVEKLRKLRRKNEKNL